MTTHPKPPVRVVAYARVSTDEQAIYGISMPAQRAALANLCEAKGWELVATCEDPAVHGPVPFRERAGGRAALRALRDGADVLLVSRPDRLGRDMVDVLTLIRDMERAGKSVRSSHTGGEKVSLASFTEAITTTIGALFAEQERGLISQRTKDALAHLRSEGKSAGRSKPITARRVLIGHDADGREKHGWEDDPAAMALCQRAVAMHERGLSMWAIAETFNSEGIPSSRGKSWYASNVRLLLLQRNGWRDHHKPAATRRRGRRPALYAGLDDIETAAAR